MVRKNHMPFNVNKCKIMHFGKKNANTKYKLLNKDVQVTREENDLRVVFTEKIFSSVNCSRVCKSANKVIDLIRRNLLNKSEDMILIMYKTLVRPIIDYCT